MAFELEVRPNLRPYEGVILLHSDSTEEEQKALFTKNKDIVEKQFGGTVKHLDTWGKRNLSNPIEKAKRAVYFHTTFEANPQAIAELERTMRINDKVLALHAHSSRRRNMDLGTHLENFKKALAESAAREREREAKFQARKAAQGSRGPRRDDEGGGGGFGGRGGGRGRDGGGFGGRGDDDGGDEAEG